MKRSPLGAPISPASPYPSSLRRIPVSMPAGIRTVTFRFTWVIPAPLQVPHRDSGTFPAPRQSGQGVILTNWPKMLWLICRSWPLPPQRGQEIRFLVLLPVPSHAVQGSAWETSISRSVPKTASSSEIQRFIIRSAPGRGPDGRCPPNPPPKKSKISPKPEKSAENPPNPPPPPV